MRAYESWLIEVPETYKSDGCTFAPDLNIRHCCVMHDWLRDHNKVSAHRQDTLFRDCVRHETCWLVAQVYFLGVRFAYFTKLYPMAVQFSKIMGWMK